MSDDSVFNLETRRLEALYRLRILDTPPEEEFDRITRLAAHLFEVPVALVTLVDADRQWFKSCYGAELLGLRETPRDLAFCNHTIQQKTPLVVPDTLLDLRFTDNPLVEGENGMRFYAGVPLENTEGLALGSLCLIDFAPREFDERQQALLKDLAAIVETQLAERRESQETLGSAHRLRTLIASTSDIITLVDAGGIIRYESEAVRTVLGYTPEELIGRQVLDMVHPDDRVAVAQTFGDLVMGVNKGLPATVTFRFAHIGGGWRILEGAGNNCLNDPAIAAIVVTSRDVTERQRVATELRNRQAHESAILETSLDGIISIDHEGIVVEWNRAAETMLKFSREDAVGRALHELIIPEEFRQGHLVGLKRYVETGFGPILGERIELPAIRGDGEQILCEVAIVPVPGTDPPLFTGHLRDITDRKKAELALHEAKVEAERANLAKSEFLSRMSHELRTPLNAVLGFGQLLELSDLAAEDQQSVTQILKGGNHLLELINEVLDISRIESGTLSISSEPVSLTQVVVEAIDLLQPLAREKNVELRSHLEPGPDGFSGSQFALADHQRLKQVLLNLLSNAIKYNRPGGWVTVDCETAEAREIAAPESIGGRTNTLTVPYWRLSVRDSGWGLTPEKMARLFTPFDRLGAEATSVDGTGIGLALSKRLTELMGGTLSAQSQEGEGCTFQVELPWAQQPLPAAEAELPPLGGAVSTRWLVLNIEDNLSNLDLLQRVLAHRPDIKLISALQGSLGLELARQHCPDLILLDLHLPELSGEEVLSQLRSDPATRGIPVVVLSADATPKRIERLIEAGAHSFIPKPFNIKHLLRVLSTILQEVEEGEVGSACQRDGADSSE